jgi:GT2 family glycosyltransferase
MPMGATPWLSVVMPTYNGAAYLSQALESVRAQADYGVEVVAVDDGSTDATAAILASFAGRLPIRVVRQSHRGNWVAGTNYGLSLARGEWACFLHQDDVWLSGRLAALRAAVRRRPQATLAVHPSWYIDRRGKKLGLWRCPLPACPWLLTPDVVVPRLLVQNFIAAPAALFRREAALGVGGLQEELWYTADWDFWLRLAAAGPTAYLPRPLAGFRVHPHSQTARHTGRREEVERQLLAVLERHLPACPGAAGGLVPAVARFALEVNVNLAAAAQGGRTDWRGLALRFAGLGPAGWHTFFRDSRIAERVVARLRAGMGTASHPPGATS